MNQNIGYQLAKFQVAQLSGSNFIEVGIRHEKHHYEVITTSFLKIGFSKFHIL